MTLQQFAPTRTFGSRTSGAMTTLSAQIGNAGAPQSSSRWHRSLEIEVLEAIREDLPQFGVQCDALTEDGLLARPTDESASPLTNVLRAFEANVLSLARLEWPSSLAAKHSTASRPRLGQRRSARTQDPPVGTRSKSCGACSRGQGTGEERRRKVKARARTGAGNTRGL